MTDRNRIRVWDPFVRIFHWLLVVCFFTAYFVDPEDSPVHVLAGYAVLTLVLARLVWGFVGSPHARFSDFVFRPSVVLRDVGDALRFRARRYIGHSPGGGAMVIALLVALLATTVSGLMVYGAEDQAGPLAGWMAGLSEQAEEILEEIHEALASMTLALVLLHVIGVVVASVSHGDNLVRSMFTGYKREAQPETPQHRE
jgi:cytochrome b